MTTHSEFWAYLDELLGNSDLVFHDPGGMRTFPVCAADGWTTQLAVLVIGYKDVPSFSKPVEVHFGCGAYTHDDGDRILKEIEKAVTVAQANRD